MAGDRRRTRLLSSAVVAALLVGGSVWLVSSIGNGVLDSDGSQGPARSASDARDDPVDDEEGGPASPAPEQPAPPAAGRDTWRVVNVVDGDTLDVRAADGTEERVRIIGIDTPERGECGYGEASIALADLVVGRPVSLVPGARDDRDRYDRMLRYVDVGSTDAGLELLLLGMATARYDSRDGYGSHPREAAYVAADAAMPDLVCGTQDTGGADTAHADPPTTPYASCDAVRAAGAAPIRRDDPGFGEHLDGDGDGVGCE